MPTCSSESKEVCMEIFLLKSRRKNIASKRYCNEVMNLDKQINFMLCFIHISKVYFLEML